MVFNGKDLLVVTRVLSDKLVVPLVGPQFF